MSATLIDLLNAVQRAQAAESKLRVLLLRGNPRQIVQQLEALEAMTGKEHKPDTGRVN